MITITDNRDHSTKQFKDIDEFDYFMCKDNLYMKIPDSMNHGRCVRAVRINNPKNMIYIDDNYPVEPVDLSIIIKDLKE